MSDKLEALHDNLDDLMEKLHKLKSKPIDIDFEEVKENETPLKLSVLEVSKIKHKLN